MSILEGLGLKTGKATAVPVPVDRAHRSGATSGAEEVPLTSHAAWSSLPLARS